MTEKEFWRLLPKTGWKMVNGGALRRRIKNDGPNYCPVTAVAHRRLGEFFFPCTFGIAAARMNLSQDFAAAIAIAADGIGNAGIRTKLLKHMGLKGRV